MTGESHRIDRQKEAGVHDKADTKDEICLEKYRFSEIILRHQRPKPTITRLVCSRFLLRDAQRSTAYTCKRNPNRCR